MEVRAGRKGFACLEVQQPSISACNRNWRAKIDDQHASGMRQLAARGEAAGALPIVAITINVGAQFGRRRNTRVSPGVHAVVVFVYLEHAVHSRRLHRYSVEATIILPKGKRKAKEPCTDHDNPAKAPIVGR